MTPSTPAGAQAKRRKQRIELCRFDNAGVEIEYVRSRNTVYVSAWYDGGYGHVSGGELPLAEFLDRLGIRAADIRRAYRDQEMPQEPQNGTVAASKGKS